MAKKHAKDTKRVNGSGSVYTMKDGRYRATATVDGKRVYRYRQTRLEAEIALAGLLTGTEPVEVRSRVSIPKPENGRTLSAWVTEWLRDGEGRLRPSTQSSYRRDLDRVVPMVGESLLTDLTAVRLLSVFTALRDNGVGDRGIQQTYTVLRTCLHAAVSLDILTVNPMDRIRKPAWRPQDRKYWTVPQTIHFLDIALASPLRLAPLCALLASTGLRVSEALGLRWQDIDIRGKRLDVRRAAVWTDGICTIVPPKTEAGRRSVSLPLQSVIALQRVPHTTAEYVFRGEAGAIPRHAHIRETLIALCGTADVPIINVHGLRHVAAATALKATKDIHAVQRRLGHSRASITMDIYAYVLTDEGDVGDALDAMLGKPDTAHNNGNKPRVAAHSPKAMKRRDAASGVKGARKQQGRQR